MYSYEDRLRGVRLYIKLDKRIGLTIRQLGYPTPCVRLVVASPFTRIIRGGATQHAKESTFPSS